MTAPVVLNAFLKIYSDARNQCWSADHATTVGMMPVLRHSDERCGFEKWITSFTHPGLNVPHCVSEAEGSHRHAERTDAESSKVRQKIRTGEVSDESRGMLHYLNLGRSSESNLFHFVTHNDLRLDRADVTVFVAFSTGNGAGPAGCMVMGNSGDAGEVSSVSN